MPPNATVAFLKSVLPETGLYCGVVFDSPNPRPGVDFPRQYVFPTVEELAEFLLVNDAQGRTVYHACASFASAQGVWNERRQKYELRSQANVRAARSLWLECDVGDTKPFRDRFEAAEAVGEFCVRSGLPHPIFVASGRGLHCYWPLVSDTDPVTWHKYATGLKGACLTYGLKADPARTADIASILRPVGTHHRKDGEREVICGPNPGPYSLGSFECLLGFVGHVAQPREVRPVQTGTVAAALLGGLTAYGATNADAIADGCAQVDGLRRSAHIAEPHWYAVAGVLSRCDEGDVKFHEWSSREYPAYNEREAQLKLDRTRALTGATTCAKLNDVNPGVCPLCPHYGALLSPVSLGMGVQTASATPTPADPPVPTSDPASSSGTNLPALPEPFRWSSRGQLCVLTEDPAGKQHLQVITEHPLFLESVQTAELDRAAFSYRFMHSLPHEGWADLIIDAQTLFGSSGIATMFGRGAVIHDSKLFLSYVRNAVDQFHKEAKLDTRYDQMGWKEDDTCFLYGKYLYTPDGVVEAMGAKEVTTRSQWLGPRKTANVHAWSEAVDSLFGLGMEAQSATVLASFAAPLMRFHSRDEGGAILHLFTPESGKGKTTALAGAWSVWGQRQGLSLTNDDTQVAKPIAIGTLGNLPVIYDELRNKDPEVIKRFVVMFTEGRDRQRGTADGGIRHTKATWQTVLLSAANTSLVEQLQDDSTDAPAFRVLELGLEMPDSVDKTQGDRLRKVLDDNAGIAGDIYLRYLLDPTVRAWTVAAVEQYTQELWTRSKLPSPHRFRVRLVAAMAVAGLIVNKLDLVHFQTSRIVTYLMNELVSPGFKGTVTQTPAPERAMAIFGDFINGHIGEMVVVQGRPGRHKQVPLIRPHNKLSMRYEMDTNKLFLSLSVFREYCEVRRLSVKGMRAILETSGLVESWQRVVTLSGGTDIPGVQVPSIEINALHPAMSGVVQMVQQTIEEKRTA